MPLPPPEQRFTRSLGELEANVLEANSEIATELRQILRETEESTLAQKFSETAVSWFVLSANRGANFPPDLWTPIGEGLGTRTQAWEISERRAIQLMTLLTASSADFMSQLADRDEYSITQVYA